MKRHLIFAILLFAICTMRLSAQTPTPVDPSWRTGTLANGMKYYIRKNAKPEGKACFWIAHDIGALHETHNQNGLAHFLEHMAFNGLKNFPGKSMLEYMQTIGCAFGANINASTGQTLTQYMLTDVPISREGVIDTCLLILHDWSGHILCEQSELDAERGVIREEWRTGRTAARRNMNERARTLYGGTPYATRSVIGDTSIINNFTQRDILDFYHAWYRPDLQAIVIVGDFDVNKMEKKVKDLFSTLKNPENPKMKTEFNIPDNVEPITNVYKEAELTSNSVGLFIKYPSLFKKENRNTEENVRYGMVTGYLTSMLNSRLNEATQNPETKFTGAYAAMGTLAGDRDVFMMSIGAKNNELTAGFDEALTFVEQARRFGFTESELERAKTNLIRSYESSYAERNNRNHNQYRGNAYSNFQYNTPFMSEEQSLELAKRMNSGIQLSEINDLIKKIVVFGPNTVIYASGPDKADVSLPDNEMLGIIMYGVGKKDLKPYEDVVIDKPLIASEIKPGKVTKQVSNKAFEATEWTLSNGMKVVLKPTTFKQDEISFSGSSKGGFSLLSDEDWLQTRNMTLGMDGIGEFDATALRKLLTGKRVNVSPSISDNSQQIGGSCSPQDLETALQLVHLYFTNPRFTQKDFDISIGHIKNDLANRGANPNSALGDTLNNLYNNYHPRSKPLTEEDLTKLNLDKMREIYQQRFANPGAFTFVFVGNLDLNIVKPLIEKYLGSLSGNQRETYKDLGKYPVQGEVKNHFKRSMQVAKATVNILYSGDLSYTPENLMAMDYLSRILRLRYTAEIREKRGGTYGASVGGGFSHEPKERYTLRIMFDTDPSMMEELVGVAHEELKKIAENGVLPEDFSKSQGNMKSQFEQNQKENNYWRGVLNNYYFNGKDQHTNWQKTFKKTDMKAIQDLAKAVLKQKNVIEVVMLPE